MYSYGPLHMAVQKQGGQLELTYSSYVRIRGVALGTYRKKWTMGRGSERGSGISVLIARQKDDDECLMSKLIVVSLYEYFSCAVFILISILFCHIKNNCVLSTKNISCAVFILVSLHMCHIKIDCRLSKITADCQYKYFSCVIFILVLIILCHIKIDYRLSI